MYDPLFRKAFANKFKKIKKLFNCRKSKEEKLEKIFDISNHPMNAFLCSSMNMELVCAILTGIQKHIELSYVKNIVRNFDHQNLLMISDFKKKPVIQLDTLEVLINDFFE